MNYAVMLSGPWGAGKTHFIKRFVARNELKHLFVSLYGMTSTRQIEEEMWRQLHPVLSSKPMKVVGSVVKGLLKGTLKIDIDGDGSDDGSISPSLPDVDLVELANPAGRILVFDDLERCRMNVDEALGYINSLVEHADFKTIVLANEEELKHKDSTYPTIKEKLIGQTLEFHSSVEDALSDFIEEIAHQPTYKYLKANRRKIIATYLFSGSSNLRVLKHALWDFERFSRGFKGRVWKNKEAASWLLTASLSLSIEYRLGRLSAHEIVELFEKRMVRLVQASGKRQNADAIEKTPIEKFEARYKLTSFDPSLYDAQVLADGLRTGWFDPSAVENGFSRSRFFHRRSKEAAWRTVWSMFEVPDKEFEVALMKMESQFRERAFVRPGEVLHVVGLRLFLAESNVLSISRSEVVTEALQYIDDLEAAHRLQEGHIDRHLSAFSGWDGLGIFEADKPDYKEVLHYLQMCMARSYERGLPAKAAELASILRKTPEIFIEQIASYGAHGAYRHTPILMHVSTELFVEYFLELHVTKQRRVMEAMKARYEHNALGGELAPELPWIKEVRGELLRRANLMTGMGRLRLSKFVEWNIDPHLTFDRVSAGSSQVVG